MRQRRHLIVAAYGGALALVLGTWVTAYVMINSRDIPPPDVRDLLEEYPDVSPADNAFTWFSEAERLLVWPEDDAPLLAYLAGESHDHALIRDHLAANAPALAMIERGLACPSCIVPEVTSLDTRLPYLTHWRNLARTLAIKARHERLKGNSTEAAATCTVLLRFSDMMLRDAACFMNFAVGLVCRRMGMAQAIDLARDQASTADSLRHLASALGAMTPLSRGMTSALKAEYRISAKAIDDLHAAKLTLNELSPGALPSWLRQIESSSYHSHPNRTKAMLADRHRALIENASLPYAKNIDLPFHSTLDRKGSSSIKILTSPNAVGKIILRMWPSFRCVLMKAYEMQALSNGTMLVLALNRYRMDVGNLPDDLLSLIPDYLESIPRDPYDGDALRYSRERGIVYTIGNNPKYYGATLPPRLIGREIRTIASGETSLLVFLLDDSPVLQDETPEDRP
jgi:hypothetical protein